jgi:hypothetical protein
MAVGLKWFIGVQRSHQPPLKWSTLATYARYIRAYVRRHLKLTELHSYDIVYKLIRLAHADEDCKSAMVASDEEIAFFLQPCSGSDIPLQAAALMISSCGLRLADLKRLRRKQIHMTLKMTRAEVRISKNRRHRGLRRILRLDANEIWGRDNPKPLVDFLDSCTEPDERIFSKITIAAFNNFIKKRAKHLSSYSFRKRFIQDIAVWKNFDWKETIRYTLHCNEDVVAAHYDSLLANIEK